MAYSTANVIAYCDTGFSATNTPANATVLQSSAQAVVDLGTINCLPLVGKSGGAIQINDFNGLSKCDYMRITFSDSPVTSYWLVVGYDYVTGDTVNVELVLDGFLTCGGTAGITQLSGYVKRHTVQDDTYGKYVQSDPLLIPSQNLVFGNISIGDKKTANEDYYIIVLSTINLLFLGALDASEMGLTYGDGTITGEVTVPNVPKIPDTWKTTVRYGTYEYDIPAGFCFDGSNATIQEAISRCRSLGIENGIIACYALPKSMFTCTIPSIQLPIVGTTETGLITVIEKNTNSTDEFTTPITFEYDNTVNNKRVLYGEYNKVKLGSISSGEQVEFNVEDLYYPNNPQTNVILERVADGRAHGKPIYYPKYFMGATQDVDRLFASVSGLEWNNVPLVFDYSSGEGIKRNRYFATTQLGAQNMLEEHQLANYMGAVNTMLGAGQGAYGGVRAYENSWKVDKETGIGAYTANPYAIGSGYAMSVLSSGMGQIGAWGQRNLAEEQYLRARRLEKKDLLIDTRVVAPEISFPVSESVRDFIGNGYYIASVHPSADDRRRMDAILTQFGYMDAGTELTVNDMVAGKYFSYIEASNVQVQTSEPVSRIIKETCEAQINAGIRIWKQRPDFSLYNSSNRN